MVYPPKGKVGWTKVSLSRLTIIWSNSELLRPTMYAGLWKAYPTHTGHTRPTQGIPATHRAYPPHIGHTRPTQETWWCLCIIYHCINDQWMHGANTQTTNTNCPCPCYFSRGDRFAWLSSRVPLLCNCQRSPSIVTDLTTRRRMTPQPLNTTPVGCAEQWIWTRLKRLTTTLSCQWGRKSWLVNGYTLRNPIQCHETITHLEPEEEDCQETTGGRTSRRILRGSVTLELNSRIWHTEWPNGELVSSSDYCAKGSSHNPQLCIATINNNIYRIIYKWYIVHISPPLCIYTINNNLYIIIYKLYQILYK